jgi:hypothetical protein
VRSVFSRQVPVFSLFSSPPPCPRRFKRSSPFYLRLLRFSVVNSVPSVPSFYLPCHGFAFPTDCGIVIRAQVCNSAGTGEGRP